jgi:hypothetical protein
MSSYIGWIAASPAERAAGKGRDATSMLYYVATFGELAGLAGWFTNIERGQPWLAMAWLVGGFAIERGAVAAWLRKFHPPELTFQPSPLPKTIAALVVATAIEISIWHVWRASAAHWNIEIAGLLLFLMIHPLHALEMAGVRHQPLIKFIIRGPTILFSFVEATGGTVALALVRAGYRWWGLVALGVALFIEHHYQGMELEDQGFRV